MSVSNMSEAAARSLGSANSYAVYTDQFDPSQLNPMPRILARQDWGITGDEFVGYDTWHCHEATFLLNNGLPMDPGSFYLDMLRLIGNKELEAMEITDYASKEPHFSTTISEEGEDLFVMTNLLRSRCRHTKQKDTGAAYFRIITKQNRVDLKDLLKEVIALREVNEFHEFCSEKLFNSIMNHPDVEDCVVMLLYARRGSLDINPVRATREELIPRALIDTGYYTRKAMGQ